MSLVVTYYGQGTLCLKSTESQNALPIRIAVDPSLSLPALPSSSPSLLDVDYILQTQSDAARLGDVLEIARRSEASIICHSDVAAWFVQQGVENVHGMTLGSGVNFPFGKLIMTLAHQGRTTAEAIANGGAAPGASAPGAPVSYLVHFNDGIDLYIAGNSAQTADMELIGKAGGVDVAILPLGDQPYNGSNDALRAAQLVQAKHVLPLRHGAPVPAGANSEQIDEGIILAERLRRVAEIDATVLQPGEEAIF